MRSNKLIPLAVVIACLAASSAPAGNRAMIERRVAELHELKGQVMDTLPDEAKKNGAHGIRVTVYPREGRILTDGGHGRAAHALGMADKVAIDGEEVTPFKDAIRRYLEKPVEIVPLPGTAGTGEYAPFSRGIRRLVRASKQKGASN